MGNSVGKVVHIQPYSCSELNKEKFYFKPILDLSPITMIP